MGPKVRILLSSSATASFVQKSTSIFKGKTISSLRDGIPQDLIPDDVCILVSPSSRQDYQAAEKIASSGQVKAVVIVNGFAKVSMETRGIL